MSSSRTTWSLISELVGEGLELSPEERAAWLERLGRTRPGLAPTVRQLIAAQAIQSGADGTDPYRAPLPAEGPRRDGDRVGPYLLVRRLGRGGMGEVWLARRDDGVLNRDVALKLPLLTPHRRDLVLRFARERDILARLEHPHIARLYDAGVADGQPYLAMELVNGQIITEYAQEAGLDLEARLELFLQVVSAVQFAHANLVLHRDLKPSNILVTAEGQVRLLDFGVAKLLEGDAPASDSPLTQASGRALTPAYASPEQILGKPLSTASDVYSLGVVLFELLTGVRPYELQGGSSAQLAVAILASEPRAPSAVLARTTGRQLVADLDTVVLKSLAKQPEDRYASAGALGEDLSRCLQREPLHAGPTSPWYRVERFVTRHRWSVLGIALAAVALVAVTGVAVVQARRAVAQEKLAKAEARNARAVKDFLEEVLAAADPASPGARPPGETTVLEAVDAASTRIVSALSGQPREKISVLTTLAGVYSSLDMTDRCLSLLQQALTVAETSEPVPNASQAAVLVELAGAAMFAGRFDDAQRWVDRAEPVFTALKDEGSEPFAQALKIRGNLARRGSAPDYRAGAVLLERSVALFRERYPDSDGRVGALFYLAQTLRATSVPTRAEAVADEAVAVASKRPRFGFEVPNAYSLRAVIRDSNGNLAGADTDFAQAHVGYLRTTGPAHFLTLQNEGLWGATVLELGGRRDEALVRIEASAEGVTRVRRGSLTQAQALERLGTAYLRVGRFERAVPVLEEARSLWGQRNETLYRSGATLALAEARAALGDLAAARALLDEALKVRQASPPTALLPEGDVHLVRGLLALDRGESAEAHTALAQALTVSGWDTRADLTRRALADAGRSRLALAAGHADQALAASERLVQLVQQPPLVQLPRVRAAALGARGASLCGAGRATEGEPMQSRAVDLVRSLVDPGSTPLIRAQLDHATCLSELGRANEATALAEEARRAIAAAGPAGATLQPMLRSIQGKLSIAAAAQ